MKRNFLKNSLAALAFSFAIIASFAFSTGTDSFNNPEYIQGNNVCTQLKTPICDELPGEDCETAAEEQVYKVSSFGTTCSSPLTRTAL